MSKISNFKLIYIIFILILILLALNIRKFGFNENKVVPVWSNAEKIYYGEEENQSLVDQVKSFLNPQNIIFQLTKVRVNVPITYLKREIPLLAYYTPEELKKPKETVYQAKSRTGTENINNKLIRLEFDLRNKPVDNNESSNIKQNNTEQTRIKPKEQIKDNTDNKPVNKKPNSQPIVAIYHTHTSETYVDDPRKQDDNGHVLPGNIGNIGKVGGALANALSKKYNFKVIHTTKVHDQKYIRSYYNSRKTAKKLIKEYSGLDMLLDVHRDGVKYGAKEAYTKVINHKKYAKVMIVVTNGKFDFANLNLENRHLEWKRNLDFAKKLASKMNKMYPGLLKKLEVRNTTYNQDLHPQALLLEIGDYQNTTQEAMRTARLVADVIASLLNDYRSNGNANS